MDAFNIEPYAHLDTSYSIEMGKRVCQYSGTSIQTHKQTESHTVVGTSRRKITSRPTINLCNIIVLYVTCDMFYGN